MVAALAELLTPPAWDFTTFSNPEGQHELVLARDVPFTSICAHHLLPFAGVAQVGVLPGNRIAGLSKLARAVEAFAARMQVAGRTRPADRHVSGTAAGMPRCGRRSGGRAPMHDAPRCPGAGR